MTNLKQLLKEKQPNAEALAAYLDALPVAEQVAQVRTLSPGLVKKMYQVTASNTPCKLEDIVPSDVDAGVEVRDRGERAGSSGGSSQEARAAAGTS